VALMSGLQVSIDSKRYASTGMCTIQDLSFHVQAGEFVAIVGPSGAGKTTLLNLIAGLDRDMDGSIELFGKPLHHNAARRENIGFLFQDSRLMPWLDVLENVRLVIAREKQNQQRASDLITQVGLEEFAHAYPGQLSGGMQRRVALARAFAVNPRLLLMDEPFHSLDAPTADYLRSLLLELWQRTRPTVLFVTHNLREALALADRIIFLSSRPAKCVLELPVNLPRPRGLEHRAVNALYESLLRRHPMLLSGLHGDDDEAQEQTQDSPVDGVFGHRFG
jgi:ABC-type nitrate/sulfonate/bicarbonate transport system ATPase subunit